MPRPRKPHHGRIIPSALGNAKLELYSHWRQSGMTKAALGRRLGIPEANVDRLFDVMHKSRLEQIEAALAVSGKRLVIQVEDAA